jgi:hypothetical protein
MEVGSTSSPLPFLRSMTVVCGPVVPTESCAIANPWNSACDIFISLLYPERTRQELDVQSALGPAFMAAKDYAAPEVGQAYARAWALCQLLGKGAEARQLLGEIYGWFTEGLDTADLQEAKALLEQST